jgi:hypothetical protein
MSPVQKPEKPRGSANPKEANALTSFEGSADDGPGGCSTKEMLKNIERSRNVYENKGNMDKMPGDKSDIFVRMTCL